MTQQLGGLDSLLEEISSFTASHSTSCSSNIGPVAPPSSESLQVAASCGVRSFEGETGCSELLFQLPAEYLGHVGQNLPDLTEELLSAQFSHESEVKRREEELAVLLTQLNREKEKLQSVTKQLCSTNKAICLAQDEEAKKREECDKRQLSLSELMTENHRLKGELQEVEGEREKVSKMLETYQAKMERHKERTAEVEKDTPLQLELEAVKKRVEDLRQKREEWLKTDWAKELASKREELVAMETTSKKLSEHSNTVKQQTEQSKEEAQKIKREMEITKKRHAAQLIRLQRQVSEAQSRKRHFTEEAERLRRAVTEIKKTMEE